MTEQEYDEYQRLVNEYNRLVEANNQLIEQIEYAEQSVVVLANNMVQVGANVVPNVQYISNKVSDADTDIGTLVNALDSLTNQYFVFKELSTASKNLTKYNDEYFTKFKFFNKLRRITLGYIIGLDSYIISNETLRKEVEKCYLSNTDYWLAYAIMSVMLWASDEKSAANRALQKALKMDSKKSAVFYMLVNLRFQRKETAANWYMYYLDRTDVNDLGDEWQKLLQAYLSGALGEDPKLEKAAKEYYEKIFVQTQAINAGYDRKVQERSETFITNFLHSTEKDYPALSMCSSDYEQIKKQLASFEKYSVVAKYFDEVFNKEDDAAENTNERIENVLYDLINSYDEKEAVVVRNIKYNEAIIAAKGDVSAAQKKYNETYGDVNKKYNAGEMLLKWAFSEDYVETDVTVKKFSISQLSDNIIEGFKTYSEKIKRELKDSINVEIDGCKLVCTKDNYEDSSKKVDEYFSKSKMSFAIKDKMFIISLFICFGGLILLGLSAMLLHTSAFPVLLTLGIVVGILGGFLVWRRFVDIGKILAEKCRKAQVKLKDIYEELNEWYKTINSEQENETDLYNSVLKFKEI